MRAFSRYLLTLIAVFFISHADSQCFNFAKKVGKAGLGEYVHDGNYNATILTEGETAELAKTFFEGQQYRICITKIDQLPDIQFRIRDEDGSILFDSAEHDNVLIWDFEPEATRLLSIEIKVLEESGKGALLRGCVAVLFGVKMNDEG